jgi:hypothetical protein
MDVLISIMMFLGIATVAVVLVATWGTKGAAIIGAGFTAYRPDGWPRGVQERDEPWSWRTPERDDDMTSPVATDRIGVPVVRRGSSVRSGPSGRR